MTDLSVIREVAVETLHDDHTVVISTSGACTLICTICGGLKSTTTYVGIQKDAWLNETRTCSCNARNPGGDEITPQPVEQAEYLKLDEVLLLRDLYNSTSMEDLRLKIPAPHLHDTYSVAFYDVLSRLHHSSTIGMARHIMRGYLPGEDWS